MRSDISFDEMLAEKKKLREGIMGPVPTKKKAIKKRKVHVKISKETTTKEEESEDSETNSNPDVEPEIQQVFIIPFFFFRFFSSLLVQFLWKFFGLFYCLFRIFSSQKTVKIPPAKKLKPKAGILINKNEPVQVNKTQQEVPEANHFEQSHPKDMVEIRRESMEKEKEKEKDKEREKEKEKAPARKPKKTEEVQVVKKKNLVTSNPSIATSSPAIPQQQSDEETEIASLVRTMGKAELTRGQIQILIDFLLNKQQDTITKEPTEWSEGKSDVLQKLKKQLSEKEELLKNEQASVVALTAKLKDLRNEYNGEKSQFNATLKAYIEEINGKNLEIRNLSQTHAADKQNLSLQFQQVQQKYMQMKEENMKTIQQLTESNNCLQQQIMFTHQQHEDSFKTLLAQKDNEICIVNQGEFFFLIWEMREFKKNLKFAELQGIKEIEKLYNVQKSELERLEENHKIEIRNVQNVLKEKELNISEFQEQVRTFVQEKRELQDQIESCKEKNNVSGKF